MSDLVRVDYDRVAQNYDGRFAAGEFPVPLQAVRSLASRLGARRILELGCGTGQSLLRCGPDDAVAFTSVGLDLSDGMLRQARRVHPSLQLVRATAPRPPFTSASFDLVYTHMAFHHFPEKPRVVEEAFRLLKPGGALAVLADDPRESDWYLYDYFEGAREIDLRRCASVAQIEDMLHLAGFPEVESPVVDDLDNMEFGKEVLASYFIQKDSVSTLILLPEDAYQAGLSRIRADITAASQRGERLGFRSHIQIRMVHGVKPS